MTRLKDIKTPADLMAAVRSAEVVGYQPAVEEALGQLTATQRAKINVTTFERASLPPDVEAAVAAKGIISEVFPGLEHRGFADTLRRLIRDHPSQVQDAFDRMKLPNAAVSAEALQALMGLKDRVGWVEGSLRNAGEAHGAGSAAIPIEGPAADRPRTWSDVEVTRMEPHHVLIQPPFRLRDHEDSLEVHAQHFPSHVLRDAYALDDGGTAFIGSAEDGFKLALLEAGRFRLYTLDEVDSSILGAIVERAHAALASAPPPEVRTPEEARASKELFFLHNVVASHLTHAFLRNVAASQVTHAVGSEPDPRARDSIQNEVKAT